MLRFFRYMLGNYGGLDFEFWSVEMTVERKSIDADSILEI